MDGIIREMSGEGGTVVGETPVLYAE